MERAAALGHTRAQAALGLDYVHGKGEPKDLKRRFTG
jgi:TPR repeat protein